MARGDGRVFQVKGSKMWYAAWNVRGQEHRSVAGEKKSEARQFLRGKVCEVASGRFVAPDAERLTVSNLLDGYFEDVIRRNRKSLRAELEKQADGSMVKKYTGPLASHRVPVEEALGTIKAMELRTDDLQRYREEREELGKSAQTVDHEVALVRAAFALARKQERISRAPYVPLVRPKNVRSGFVEQTDAERLAASAAFGGEPYESLTLFASVSAWRASECESLTWEQVDREAREIRLYDSKSGAGRVLPMDDYLFDLIERMRKRRDFETPTGTEISRLVFHVNGNPAGDWRKRWQAGCVETGLGHYEKDEQGKRRYIGLLFHDLRRSAIRNLIRAGVPQSVVMAISGHKTISVFLRYDIASEEDKRNALEQAALYREARRERSKVVALGKKSESQRAPAATA